MNSSLPVEPALAVDNITVSLGNRVVLRGVTLNMAPGEITGLIGANGAGKTTLMRAVLGLVRPTSGKVLICGRPRSRRNPLIGYVPQRFVLDNDMPLRARDLIGLGLDGHRFGIPLPSARRRRMVDEMIVAVDAANFADARVGSLSGGEQQRVLIAHALISRPRLLLLDEPLANLDLRSEQSVVQVLARIAREQDVAVLISTHDMNPLLPVMDSVAYVAGGRVASGPVAEVVSTEALSRLYGYHVDVIRIHDRVIVVAGREGEMHDHAGDAPVASVV